MKKIFFPLFALLKLFQVYSMKLFFRIKTSSEQTIVVFFSKSFHVSQVVTHKLT